MVKYISYVLLCSDVCAEWSGNHYNVKISGKKFKISRAPKRTQARRTSKEGLVGVGEAQCVGLDLRWHFCVRGSTCPEIYFYSKFWLIFDILNPWSWLWFARKHIWNIIEEIVWANPSRDLVFEILKKYAKHWLEVDFRAYTGAHTKPPRGHLNFNSKHCAPPSLVPPALERGCFGIYFPRRVGQSLTHKSTLRRWLLEFFFGYIGSWEENCMS